MNYCQENHLPVDFVSTHPYPQDFAIDQPGASEQQHYRRSIDATRDDLRTLREMIDHSPYPNAEIELTEWNSSPSPVDHSHDSLAAGGVRCEDEFGKHRSGRFAFLLGVYRRLQHEENRNIDSVFHGGFGLINYQQIVKPAFHAYRMMNELGDQTLAQIPGGIMTRFSTNGHIAVMAYNYPPEVKVSLPVSNSLQGRRISIDNSGSDARLSPWICRICRPAHRLSSRRSISNMAMPSQRGKPWGSRNRPTKNRQSCFEKRRGPLRKQIVRADSEGNLHIETKSFRRGH